MDLMIDIETLGARKDAVITHLGWALFDPFAEPGLGVARSGTLHATIQSSLDWGMTVDGDTIKWWLGQSEAARAPLHEPRERLPIEGVLGRLAGLYSNLRAEKVWGCPATFDLAILEQAFRMTDVRCSWGYRDQRCGSTVMKLAGVERTPVALLHDPMQDALGQCLDVQRALKRLGVTEHWDFTKGPKA